MPAYTYQESIAALFIGALGTGMYLCTLAYALRWLVFDDAGWKLRRNINYMMLTATLVLFTLSSTHLGLAVVLTVTWADNAVNRVPNTDKVTWPATVMCGAANTTVLIADAFLIYRCWLVCSKSIRCIIFPSIFWIGGVACTGLQIYWQIVKGTEALSTKWMPVNMAIGPGTVLTPFWASTIVINLYTTGHIVYCIWEAAKNQKQVQGSTHDLHFIIRVLLDSGMMYLIITIPHFIVWWTPNSSGAILVLAWLNLPVVCSAFNLILIRTSHHRASGDHEEAVSGEMVSEMQFQHPKQADAEHTIGYHHRLGLDDLHGTTISFGSTVTI